MSMTTLTYPNVRRDRQTPAVGLRTILMITSVALIAGAILTIVMLPNQDEKQADLIPVAQTSPAVLAVAVPIPIPPAVDVQPVLLETPAPSTAEIGQSVVAVPVPTP